ncbi:Uncharacterised protein [Mycoplasmopsis citelli]|uniref:Uncharacterized protein n=1 Tax=Mycoplasmopsis citelli TaxID=171281 RepID=A0A449B123_9BACT|nr:hypothetical protein [Mycoplasmopsis citelli]VEU74300.1 Uncharacterised protein [Mycoplasmopsis citelli]
MKLQTDKFKKYKSLKLWKNFNFFDFALLIVILFIAGSIAYYSPVSNLLKIAIFSSIVILNAPLFIEIPGKNARGYVVLAWIFIHLIRVKKFKKKTKNDLAHKT